jgi:hypothetical protein
MTRTGRSIQIVCVALLGACVNTDIRPIGRQLPCLLDAGIVSSESGVVVLRAPLENT